MPDPELSPQERRIVYRLICLVTWADRSLVSSELTYLKEVYQRLGIGTDDMTTVQIESPGEKEVSQLVKQLSEEVRYRLCEELLDAAWVDRAIQEEEARLIVEAVVEQLRLPRSV